ncbi:adrenocortical dysplasia protein homolog [Eublepharis macularius]|uniref:Adrenocortical dysplasia protein homolog n=1 Tax=Eublepharis macularius TaxID=481883 RepID=A0AA97KI35_EUBMA|nr:adrenocortical dysplasia protein homolog [Eublepharis macularius]
MQPKSCFHGRANAYLVCPVCKAPLSTLRVPASRKGRLAQREPEVLGRLGALFRNSISCCRFRFLLCRGSLARSVLGKGGSDRPASLFGLQRLGLSVEGKSGAETRECGFLSTRGRERLGAARGRISGAPMSPGRSRYPLRARKSPSRHLRSGAPSQGLDNEDRQTDRNQPSYLEPWIVNLLLQYNESEARPEGQFGQVLKVLNEASTPDQNGQEPAAIVHIADGRHYIQAVVPARAIQTAKCFPPQSGFSSILGQFIVLQNFRVCVKEATKMEDSGFYLELNCFRVTSMKRRAMRQQDCNREPSVLQKIKELWLRGFALQPLPSSEPSSVSEVLREMKQDKLSTLKKNIEDCLSSVDPRNLLDAEQLAVYPDTKWQVERKQDKVQRQDIFTVPAKLLVIGAEDEAVLSSSYPPKPSHVASDSESSPDDDHSTISFISAAEAETLDGPMENPWDIFPGMTLMSSKEMSDMQPSLPNTQQMFLASTAEEENAAGSSSCTPDGLHSCDPAPHCSSTHNEPGDVTSPSLLPPHKEGNNPESISDTDGSSIPNGQPLKNSDSHASACCLSPVCLTIRSTLPPKPLSEDVEENQPADLQREMVMVRGAGEKSLETSRKYGAPKRKQLMPDDEESAETSHRPCCISPKGQDSTSAMASPKFSRLDRQRVARKPPLVFVRESTPKKSRIDEIHVQQLQASAQSRCAGRRLEKMKEQTATTGRQADSCEGQLGGQKQDRVRRAVFHHAYQPATTELCSQVHSTRISRALLGWARWVFRNGQKQ